MLQRSMPLHKIQEEIHASCIFCLSLRHPIAGVPFHGVFAILVL